MLDLFNCRHVQQLVFNDDFIHTMTDIIPMKRFVFCVLCVYIVNVSGNEKTPLITSYAKVSMSGNSNYNGTNEGRSYLAGQTLWTQR